MSEPGTPVFVIDPAPVPWPVDVRVPAAGGTFITRRFTALINVLSESEYQRLLDVPEADPAAPEKTEKEHLEDNAQLFPGFIAGWDGVAQADGTPVPYSTKALADLVTGPYGKAVSAGLWRAVSEVRHGVRLGNFEAPSVTG
jgi:hypothetical protein